MTTPPIISPLMLAQNKAIGPAPLPSSMVMPGSLPAIDAPVMPTVTKAPTQTDVDQAHRTQLINSGDGISQIHNPLLRGVARAADIAGTVFAPGLAMAIPGTMLHHEMLVNQATKNVAADQAQEQATAQTDNENLKPIVNQQKAELAHEKQSNTEQQQAAQHGLMRVVDPTTGESSLVVDPNSPVTKANADKDAKVQAATEYLGAQTDSAQAQKELRDAQTAYTNNKSDPNSLISQQIASRLATAQKNAQTSSGRLSQAQLTYRARYLGTGADGQALPGAMLTDDGTPVGSTFSTNVRPTGTERNKGDMANSADVQLGVIKSIMQKHGTIFGPGYGQTSAFRQWIGSEDQDAQRFLAARTIAADHLAGTFGGRSEAALTALDNAIGQFKDNPAAAIAGVDQLSGANKSFMKAGTVHTAGGNAGAANSGGGGKADFVYVQGKGLVKQ